MRELWTDSGTGMYMGHKDNKNNTRLDPIFPANSISLLLICVLYIGVCYLSNQNYNNSW